LYVTPPAGGAVARLSGFQRIDLQPGETRHVTLSAERRTLAKWDEAGNGWHLLAGTYRAAIGHDALDLALTGSATLAEQRFRP
jgi:beta-glucosidase